MNRYAFIHVPKTAGISFWHAFRHTFGAECVSPHVLDSSISPSEALELNGLRVISGHLSYRDLDSFFYDRIWMTVLRHPIDRALSQYFHFRTIAPPDRPGPKVALQHSVDEYFFLPRSFLGAMSNRAVQQLGAHVMDRECDLDAALQCAKQTLRRCRWVGIYEELPRHIEVMRRTEPDFANFQLPREHVTPERVSADELSAAVRARILELNIYDLQLYEWAKSEFHY